jgi:hypothetical protein
MTSKVCLLRCSESNSNVSSNKILLNRETTLKLTKMSVSWRLMWLRFLIKATEFLMWWSDYSTKGQTKLAQYFAHPYMGKPMQFPIGHSDTSSLWIFSRPRLYGLFPGMKAVLKGHRFQSAQDVRLATTTAFQSQEKAGTCASSSVKCLTAEWNYFKGSVQYNPSWCRQKFTNCSTLLTVNHPKYCKPMSKRDLRYSDHGPRGCDTTQFCR